jgi:hypothetical protein
MLEHDRKDAALSTINLIAAPVRDPDHSEKISGRSDFRVVAR